jgi:hypothetical protein
VQKYYDDVLSAVGSISGVEEAALAQRVPLSQSGSRAAKSVFIDPPSPYSEQPARVGFSSVSSALGGDRWTVASIVLRHALFLCMAGLAAGVVLAFIGGQAISALLLRVTPFDAVTFAGVAILSAVTALMASAVPLRTALQVDPIQVLRHE